MCDSCAWANEGGGGGKRDRTLVIWSVSRDGVIFWGMNFLEIGCNSWGGWGACISGEVGLFIF